DSTVNEETNLNPTQVFEGASIGEGLAVAQPTESADAVDVMPETQQMEDASSIFEENYVRPQETSSSGSLSDTHTMDSESELSETRDDAQVDERELAETRDDPQVDEAELAETRDDPPAEESELAETRDDPPAEESELTETRDSEPLPEEPAKDDRRPTGLSKTQAVPDGSAISVDGLPTRSGILNESGNTSGVFGTQIDFTLHQKSEPKSKGKDSAPDRPPKKPLKRSSTGNTELFDELRDLIGDEFDGV
ncbi:MAG: hypothetical protein AAF517_26695, partial [Planctomycetota bacterium]